MAEYQIDQAKVQERLKDMDESQKTLATVLFPPPRYTLKSAESKMSRCLRGRSRLSETQLRKMGEFLDMRRSEFGEEPEPPKILYTLSKLYDLYDMLPQGSTVSIVSADGFKESYDRDLQQKMVELVQRGVQVNYYYPAHGGQHGASAYRRLRDRLRSTLDKQYHSLVQGFQVGLPGMQLFGWQTRHIIFTRWNEQKDAQEVRDGFLYAVSADVAEGDLPEGDMHECWLRQPKSVARDYYRALCDHAEPVADLGIYSNRLKSQIQGLYQKQFGQPEHLHTYRELRDIIDSTGMVCQLIDTYFQRWWNEQEKTEPRSPAIRVLDVGAGDGNVLGDVLDMLHEKIELASGSPALHVTALESSDIAEKDQHKCLRHSATVSVLSSFEDYQPHHEEFDLILAVHSLYLIDPSYLLRMYDLLSDAGMMIVVAAPYSNNVLNLICAGVDTALRSRHKRLNLQPYEGKTIAEDPLRNYAEDLRDAAISLFGTDVLHAHEPLAAFDKPHKPSNPPAHDVPLGTFVTESGRFTALGRKVVRLFGQGMLNEDEEEIAEIEAIVRKKIDTITTVEGVRNENWGFVLFKSEIRSHLRKKLWGRIV